MKEIGLKLKEKREENGLSIEEVAEDLNIRPNQLISLEEGNKGEFDDVIFLKNLIKSYSKYLGLDDEKMEDEFNDFLFEYTSKIPVQEIEIAKEQKNKEEEKIVSPYTSFDSNMKKINMKFILIVVGVVFFILISMITFINLNDSSVNNDEIVYVIRR